MADGLTARREAALRLPPLADGRRDPVLERPRCEDCGDDRHTLIPISGRLVCRDRLACYQHQTRRKNHAEGN